MGKLLLSMLRFLTPSTTSRPRFKTRKEFLLINRDSSSLEGNFRMAGLSPTTTFNKTPLFTLSSDSEEIFEILFFLPYFSS